jgi:hypothetical protein
LFDRFEKRVLLASGLCKWMKVVTVVLKCSVIICQCFDPLFIVLAGTNIITMEVQAFFYFGYLWNSSDHKASLLIVVIISF